MMGSGLQKNLLSLGSSPKGITTSYCSQFENARKNLASSNSPNMAMGIRKYVHKTCILCLAQNVAVLLNRWSQSEVFYNT